MSLKLAEAQNELDLKNIPKVIQDEKGDLQIESTIFNA
jgi:hypothetical protein